MPTVKQFSIGATVGVAIGLVGAGIQSRWPDKNVGTGLMIVGGLVLIIALVAAFVRWLTIREYERQHLPTSQIAPARLIQHAENRGQFNPRNEQQNIFQPNIHVSASGLTHSQQQPQRRKAPIFEATANSRITQYGLDLDTGLLIREPYYGKPEDLPDNRRIVNVALAQFLHRPSSDTEANVYVTAHVFVHNPQGEVLLPELYKTIWDGDDVEPSREFSAGQAHDLIMAIFPILDEPGAIMLYEYNTQKSEGYWGSNTEVSPKHHKLEGQIFWIKVDLLPKRWREPFPVQSFWFRLTLKDAELRRASSLGHLPSFIKS